MCVIFATDVCPKLLYCVKKYCRNQNEKVKGCTFKDFILDYVQKIAALAQRRGE
jgi:hypothetical protein